MNKNINPRIAEVAEKVVQAAKDTLGDKLEKVILYGSYAHGDYDDYSDVDFFILARVPQNEAGKWRGNIRNQLPGIDLDYDICVSLHLTGSEIFYEYADTLPFFMNVIREGVPLSD